MHLLNTLFLATFVAQLGSALVASGRYERRHHQKRQLIPSGAPNSLPPWAEVYSQHPSGHYPRVKTSTRTVTVTDHSGAPTIPVIVATAQLMNTLSALGESPPSKPPTATFSSDVQSVSVSTPGIPSTAINWTPIHSPCPPSRVTSSTNVEPLSSVSVTANIIPSQSSSPVALGSTCPSIAYAPAKYMPMPAYIGLNVVNTKPFAPGTPALGFKQPQDWDTAFEIVKKNLPNTNAVRMYSTIDGNSPNLVTHLMNALPAAQKHDLKILAGVWSGGLDHKPRFEQEIAALGDAVEKHGCANLAAIGVGNEDLNDINKMGLDNSASVTRKAETADLLIDQMNQVRTLLRKKGCCSTPVTHVDTWNELFNTDSAWIPKLIQATDQAVIVNIFPFWSNATVQTSWGNLTYQANLTNYAAQKFERDLWLGESGWPQVDKGNHNGMGTSMHDAQSYFNIFGCQFLHGNGTAFYYVDWDEDKKSGNDPSFGLFKANGEPYFDISCPGWKPDTRVKAEYPAWLGGKGL